MRQGSRLPGVASLRLVSSGGAGVTPAFAERAASTLGCVVKRTYGSTEAPTITTWQPGDDAALARSVRWAADGFSGNCGSMMSQASLQVRGPELFVRYLSAPQTDAAFTDDGWFRTGDIGALDGEWLTIIGRLKDIIIRGGENIAVAEVESVLEAHPLVRQAVALGVPHELLGEQVVAFVVLGTGAAFDLESCRSWFESQVLRSSRLMNEWWWSTTCP